MLPNPIADPEAAKINATLEPQLPLLGPNSALSIFFSCWLQHLGFHLFYHNSTFYETFILL